MDHKGKENKLQKTNEVDDIAGRSQEGKTKYVIMIQLFILGSSPQQTIKEHLSIYSRNEWLKEISKNNPISKSSYTEQKLARNTSSL